MEETLKGIIRTKNRPWRAKMADEYATVYAHNSEEEYLSYLPYNRQTWYTKGFFLSEDDLRMVKRIAYLQALNDIEHSPDLGVVSPLEMIRKLKGTI